MCDYANSSTKKNPPIQSNVQLLNPFWVLNALTKGHYPSKNSFISPNHVGILTLQKKNKEEDDKPSQSVNNDCVCRNIMETWGQQEKTVFEWVGPNSHFMS